MDLLALLDSQNLSQVEDSLFPVCVFCVWASRESDWLVAGGEVDVKPSDECMNEIVATAVKKKGGGEGEVFGCACVEVKSEDGGRVGYDCFDFDGIDERFSEGGMLEGRVVEAIYIVPDLF